MNVVLLAISILHIILSAVATTQISKSILFTKKQKVINISLLWLVPFLWFLTIKMIHKPSPGSASIPKKNDISSNNFYDQGE